MENKSRTSKNLNVVLKIFMAVGFLMLALTVYLMIHDNTKKKNAVACDGVIVQVFQDRTMLGFEYEDEILIRPFGGTNSAWYEGMFIEILYNPVKDRIYISSMDTMRILVCGGLGLIFALAGLIPFVIGKKKGNKYLRLKNEGVCLECTITDVYINDALYMNSRHPVVLTCSYKNSDGTEYRFTSKNILVDSYDFYKVGDKINVYANKENYKDYIVEAGV